MAGGEVFRLSIYDHSEVEMVDGCLPEPADSLADTHTHDQTQARDFGGYEYQFLNPPADGSDVLCKICCLPSRDPYLSQCCGHTFCKSCIDGTKKTSTVSNACPMCRDKEFPTVPNKQIDRTIKSLYVFCNNKSKGCDWQGEVNDITKHLTSCPYEGVICDNNCGESVQRQHLSDHLVKHCSLRIVHCQHCHTTGQHQMIEGDHKNQCPKFPIPCPNHCTVGTVCREELDAHKTVCPLELISCEYHDVGCEVMLARKDMKKHNKESVDEHLSLVKCELASTKNELVQARKEAAAADKKIILTEKRIMVKVIAHVGEVLADLSDKLETKIDNVEVDGRKMVKSLETQLYNSMKQIHKDCSPWILKLTSLDTMSKSGDQAVPVVFKMSDFSKYKGDKEWWYSPTFHADHKGYMMCMTACAAGHDTGQGTHLSVGLFLIKRPRHNTGLLSKVEFKVQLLNQISDEEHHTVTISSDDHSTTDDKISSKLKAFEGWRRLQFISYQKLGLNTAQCSFLKFDCLYFQVQVKSVLQDSSSSMEPHPPTASVPFSMPVAMVSQLLCI